MALQQSFSATTNLGTQVTFPKAYVKVEKIIGNLSLLEIYLAVYSAKGETFIESKKYLFIPSAEGYNFVKQAYLYLKSLPEFADVVDC
jgi:hypothetical protein